MLFKAESKVQKDRAILRETDARMAKYSRRGLVINLLAYLLCASLGDMHVVAPTASVVLTAGLILTLLIRGYILLRFEAIYSRGPARWRTMFFLATLTGAIWWSVILTSLTLVLGMVSETPILLFYTVIFFSTTIHVTAPFREFSRIYVAFALVPPMIAAFYTGGFDGYMYGVMMLVFIITLDHQAELLSNTHWQRLASNLELKQKARALEVEKRKVDASIELNTQYLNSFCEELNNSHEEMKTLVENPGTGSADERTERLNSILQQQMLLLKHTRVFTKINAGDIEPNFAVVPLRQILVSWIEEFQSEAVQHNIELHHRLHPECPEKAKLDPQILGRIFANLLGNAVRYSHEGEIFVDIDFRVSQDSIGYLEINFIDRGEKTGMEGDIDLQKFLVRTRLSGLWFPFCKSLAEALGGTIEVDHDKREIHYLFRLPVICVESTEAADCEFDSSTGWISNPADGS